jgi:hypothetical protein
VPLTLVAASFDAGTSALSLTFDRAVDFEGIVPAQFVVFDGGQDVEWGGTATVWQTTVENVSIAMIENGEFTGEGVTLSVGAANGLVAVDDGGTWAGVSGLVLPFP